MKAISSFTWSNVGARDKLERGKLIVEKGKVLAGILCKFTVPLANASGGAVAMTDTQRQAFLSGWRMTLNYGKGNKRKPYNSMLFTRLQRISRFLIGQDWEGYASTTTGLARSLPDSATTAVTFWALVPTSLMWHHKGIAKVMAVGRTQAATMELEMVREADTLPTGVTVSGNVTATLYPQTVSQPHDHFFYLPEWYEVDETDKVAKGPTGLHLYTAEETAILTSTTLTNIELRIGREVIYTGIDPNSAYIPTLQLTNVPSEADVSDRETVLYQWTQDREFQDLPVGRVEVDQITKNLATFKLRGLYLPIPDDNEVRADVQEASGKKGRNKPLKAINAAVVMGMDWPETHHAYAGFVLVDGQTAEFSRFPGLVGEGDTAAVDPYIPASVVDNSRELIAQYALKGEVFNAEGVRRRVALAVPAAIQDVEGFAQRGSVVLDQVSGVIAR
ncbi:hypothetical protein [Hyalangium sp.]|uniref:hypothetical protein n=1 Tax=Hyalangium sp. TaxID=2028555 RepID=UPI002D63009D|nr:hypothetical protein [Hyalangium sp.]HYI00568.1 hypothetical protein [Hyalangium sp.]